MKMFETLNRKETRSAKWDGAQKKTHNADVIPMSVADSDYETAPEILAALTERIEHGAFGYTYLDRTFYESIIAWVHRRYQLTIKRSWLLAAPKVLTALAITVESCTEVGDAVVIQTPVYQMFEKTIKAVERTVINNPLIREGTQYTMDLDDLETHFKNGAKAMVLCNPHNPVGRVFSVEELDALLNLCKRYNVVIISDEIHADLIMKPHQFTSLGAFFEKYSTMVLLHAPSKTFNIAGLQTAFLITNSTTIKKRLRAKLNRYFLSGLNTLGLTALIAAYTQGDAFVDAQNSHIQDQFNCLKTQMKAMHSGLRVTPLEGTYLAWIDARAVFTSEAQLIERFEAAGVVVSEGSTYAPEYEGFFRLNLACSRAQLDTVLKRIAKAIDMAG